MEANGGSFYFQQFFMSKDPSIRKCAENARNSFNDIRNSPNPLLHLYYQNILVTRLARVRETREDKKTKRALETLQAFERRVLMSGEEDKHVSITSRIFSFTISK